MDVFFLLVLAIPILVIAAAIVNSILRPASEDRPRGFPWIMLLFGVGVAGGIIIFLTMARGRQELVIRVTGPPGAEFTGEAIVDDKVHEIEGIAPAELQFVGRMFGVVVLAVEPDTDRPLEVSFEGDFSGIALSDPYGVRFGAFKRVLAGGAGCTPISEQEWSNMIEQFGPSVEVNESLLPGAPSNSDATNEPPPDASSAPGGM